MATIRPKDLPAAASVTADGAFVVDTGATVEKATAAQIVDAAIPLASQADAEAGTDNAKRVTPLRVKQAIDALGVSAANLASTASGKGADLVAGADKVIRPEDKGAVGDGATDDAAAIQDAIDALAALGGGTMVFAPGTYIVGQKLDGMALSGCRILGPGATLKAKDGVGFDFMLEIATTTGVVIDGLSFDANKSGRAGTGSTTWGLACLSVRSTTRCSLLNVTVGNSLGYVNGLGEHKSWVAISASAYPGQPAGPQHLRVINLKAHDCGISANDHPSDGIYVRGDYCEIIGSHAENITDSAFVLEGSTHSMIDACTGKNCTSFAWISNDTASDLYGNMVSNVTVSCNYVGSGGGVVGCFTSSTGKIIGPIFNNINVVIDPAAGGGGGPGIYFASNVERARIVNCVVDATTTSGKLNHGILIDGSISINIQNAKIRGDGGASTSGVRLLNASSGVTIEGSTFENVVNGISADGTSDFTEQNNSFVSYTDRVTIGGSATYYGDTPQTIAPTVTSDVGDAAASFDAAGQPTFTAAKARRNGPYAKLEVYMNATVKSGANLSYIDLSVPAWMTPLSDTSRFVAEGVYAGTAATFMARPLTTGVIRLYRGGGIGTFDATAGIVPVEVFFALEYEVG